MEPFETLDKLFARYTIRSEKLHMGLRWAEVRFISPINAVSCSVICPPIRSRVDSRLPRSPPSASIELLQWQHAPARCLITCEHRGRRVTRTEYDGTITVLADRYDGKRLNSPNDVVVKSDGTVWFTDPTYGISAAYEGGKAESEIGSCNVYCFDPRDGSLRIVADDFRRPNGLAFHPTRSRSYRGFGRRTWTGPSHPGLRVGDVNSARAA
jgi:gluconolactonase